MTMSLLYKYVTFYYKISIDREYDCPSLSMFQPGPVSNKHKVVPRWKENPKGIHTWNANRRKARIGGAGVRRENRGRREDKGPYKMKPRVFSSERDRKPS